MQQLVQRLIYWNEICTELQLGRLADWGSVLPEAPALWDGCWSGWVNALTMYGRSNLVLILNVSF